MTTNITIENRTFTVDEEGVIFDENFDFDASIMIFGDFADREERIQYAQMIANAINEYAKEQKW